MFDPNDINKTAFIHYGSDRFHIDKFKPIKNSNVKPSGGLWASPINSKCGWKDFCEAENFGDLSSSFVFAFTGKALIIDAFSDFEALPFIGSRYGEYPNFELISESYDGILLTDAGQWATRLTFPRSLYGWDCESLLVLNPKTIALELNNALTKAKDETENIEEAIAQPTTA